MDDDLLLPAVQMDDAFDFTTKPAGPEPYMEWKLKEVMISGYQMSHDDGDGGSIDGLAVDPNNPNAEVNHSEFLVVKLLDATTPKVHMDDGLLLPAVQTDDAVTWTAIAMAESGGNTGAHNPRGEDSRGLWQINVDPAQTNNPDTFDCSELVQLASEPAELPGQSTVATETLTIVHEGFLV